MRRVGIGGLRGRVEGEDSNDCGNDSESSRDVALGWGGTSEKERKVPIT